MKILVTGATGNVGSLVTRRLIDRGDRPAGGRITTVTGEVQRVLGRAALPFGRRVQVGVDAR